MDFTIMVSVTFYACRRRTVPCLHNEKYRPHFVVKGDAEYLGVCFIDGAVCEFDKAVSAAVLPIYEGVGYDKLKPQTQFYIMEGAQMVGEGVVESVFFHIPYKELIQKNRTS